MSSLRFQKGILLLTLALVLVLGLSVYISLLSHSPGEQEFQSLAEQRQPASLASVVSDVKGLAQEDEKMAVLGLDCIRKGTLPGVVSDARQIRLLGRYCVPVAEDRLVKTSIKNRTNGFEATTFNLENNGYTSDYISLSQGENNILLSFEGESGVKTLAEVTVTRSE